MRRRVAVIAGLFLCFSVGMLVTSDTGALVIDADSNPVRVSYRDPPPPPRRATISDTARKIYIAVIDREYKPSPVQCALKKAWIDRASKLEFVDGVEFYSSASFVNERCGVTTISFPPPDDRFDVSYMPSCMIMRHVIRSFLERSDAGWLLYVTDATYVDPDKLESLIDRRTVVPEIEQRIRGQCIEVRDYFQVFVEESGAMISRATAARVNLTTKTWDVACSIQISGNEVMGHVLDVHGMSAVHNHDKSFLGQPFPAAQDYTALRTRNFQKLAPCPPSYAHWRVCHPRIHRLSEVVVWGGAGRALSKLDFINSAAGMLRDLPPDVSFMYNTHEAELCLQNAK